MPEARATKWSKLKLPIPRALATLMQLSVLPGSGSIGEVRFHSLLAVGIGYACTSMFGLGACCTKWDSCIAHAVCLLLDRFL